MTIENISKIFMLGDLHLGTRNNSMVWKDDMIDFLDKFVDNLPNHGFNEDTDILMLPGDIFHSREFLNVMIGNAAMAAFQRLTSVFKRGVFVILGNHDVYMKYNTDVHTLKFFEKSYSNFHVFTKPEVFEINGRHRFLMLPWNDDGEELAKSINDNRDCDYLFCHMDIHGFKYNKAIRVDGGVLREDLLSFKKVYAGHLHHRQASGNVLYLGTPYQLDSGDMGTERGYYVLNIIGDMMHEEYFPNEWSPRFEMIEFDELMEMTFEEAARALNRNYVSVAIPNSSARNFSLNAFDEAMRQNAITPRKIEFKPYDDSYEIEEATFDATSDFNLATTAKVILEEKKYSHSEAASILTYFNELHTIARNNDKETYRQ